MLYVPIICICMKYSNIFKSLKFNGFAHFAASRKIYHRCILILNMLLYRGGEECVGGGGRGVEVTMSKVHLLL